MHLLTHALRTSFPLTNSQNSLFIRHASLSDIKSANVHSAPIIISRCGITVHLSLGVAPPPPHQEPEKTSSERVRELLFSPEIDVASLRSLVFGGCPSETVLRSTLWRILLGYLPLQRDHWSRHVAHKRQQYTDFCAEFIIEPDTLADNEDDDPLGACAGEQGSKYSDYFKNKELMLEIDKDTKRTWTSMHFFATPDESQQHCKQGAGPSSQQVRTPLLSPCPGTVLPFLMGVSFISLGRGHTSSASRACCSCSRG